MGDTTPVPIKSLKPGSFIIIDDEPCKVLDIVISKPGKHGATKARIDAMGLFDSRRHVLLKPSADNVDQPMIEKRKGQVINVTGDIVQLMDMEDYQTFEATIPEELKGKIEIGSEVGYWKVTGRVILKG
ncbi:MAG: translation initiation factor IF-5A [Candidatus Aenigmarchaeota archaeon]|nr:translation initiation factor IF-5A [Candidatus Aenigmarchaeota archaeon]